MSGSGLKELLSTVYAEQTVPHMLSGKGIPRAIRGHLLNSVALNTLLMSQCLDVLLPVSSPQVPLAGDEVDSNADETAENEVHIDICDEFKLPEDKAHEVLDALDSLFTDLLSNKESPFDAGKKTSMLSLYKRYNELRATLQDRTSLLWLMYLDMVDILCVFIKGERTGDSNLHLQSMASMLPFLASSGHFNYEKSVLLYLQKMEELEFTNPFIYQRFRNEYHVV